MSYEQTDIHITGKTAKYHTRAVSRRYFLTLHSDTSAQWMLNQGWFWRAMRRGYKSDTKRFHQEDVDDMGRTPSTEHILKPNPHSTPAMCTRPRIETGGILANRNVNELCITHHTKIHTEKDAHGVGESETDLVVCESLLSPCSIRCSWVHVGCTRTSTTPS